MVQKVRVKRGIFFFSPLNPSSLASEIYAVILSVLGANSLWIICLTLCAGLKTYDIDYVMNALIAVNLVFSSCAFGLYLVVYHEKGENVFSLLMTYIWMGGKIFLAIVELYFCQDIFQEILDSGHARDIFRKLFAGALVVLILECYTMYVGFKYAKLRSKRPSKTTAYTSTTTTV